MIPYWLYYRASGALGFCEPGSAVIIQDNEELASLDGAALAVLGLSPIIYCACNNENFTNPATFDCYLADLQRRLVLKGITPLAMMVEEEWYDRINGPDVGGWPCFSNMDPWLRKMLIRDRLTTFYGMIKARWPWCYTVAVESKWNDDGNWGVLLWYPPPVVDVLGCDPYLHAHGWPPMGTPPLVPDDTPEMRQKFDLEIGAVVKGYHFADGREWRGAASYGKPLMLVGQGFKDRDPAGMWSVAPSGVQLGWWYSLACSTPSVVGLGWFCVRSAPSVIGLDGLPEQAAAVHALWTQNHAPD